MEGSSWLLYIPTLEASASIISIQSPQLASCRKHPCNHVQGRRKPVKREQTLPPASISRHSFPDRTYVWLACSSVQANRHSSTSSSLPSGHPTCKRHIQAAES